MLSMQKEGLRCQTSQESIKVCNFGTAADYLFKNEDDIKSYIASGTYWVTFGPSGAVQTVSKQP